MTTLSEAFRYIMRPHFVAQRRRMDLDGVRHLTSLLLVTLVLGVFLTAFVGSVIISVMGEIPENVNGTLAQTDVQQLIILGVLIAPVMEEIIFRSWLGFPRSSVLGFPVLVCLLTFLAGLSMEWTGTIILPIAFVLGCFLAILIRRFGTLSAAEQAVARRRLFPAAFWGTILVFALIHLSNFEGGVAGALAAPILFLAVTPQIIAGAVLGYVRMRFGLIAAIIFHMAYNAVLITLAVMAAGAAPADASAENLAISGLALLQSVAPLA